MTLSCTIIVDRKYQVQYLTVSKSYSDDCTCNFADSHKHLGVTLRSTGQWLLHIENTVKLATKKFGYYAKT